MWLGNEGHVVWWGRKGMLVFLRFFTVAFPLISLSLSLSSHF